MGWGEKGTTHGGAILGCRSCLAMPICLTEHLLYPLLRQSPPFGSWRNQGTKRLVSCPRTTAGTGMFYRLNYTCFLKHLPMHPASSPIFYCAAPARARDHRKGTHLAG